MFLWWRILSISLPCGERSAAFSFKTHTVGNAPGGNDLTCLNIEASPICMARTCISEQESFSEKMLTHELTGATDLRVLKRNGACEPAGTAQAGDKKR